jgi:hypothetical protein
LSGVAFAGFFALSQKGPTEPFSLLAVCCLGYIISFAWLLANRGSKYWQENWEVQVDLLENFNIGPIFKTNIKPDRSALNQLNLFAPYPFSVTKINQILSGFVCLLWLVLLWKSVDEMGFGFSGTFSYPGATLLITFIFSVMLFKFGRTSLEAEKPINFIRRTYTAPPDPRSMPGRVTNEPHKS